jgi:PncC family amidohydrolase
VSTSIAAPIITALKRREESLAVAESITGGALGAAITSVPGSSDVFVGGIIAYQLSVKNVY